ncbi:hypothetical protein ACH5RR_012851 [Cinchona calisaya]|uniref:Uncharacterized protein n=1 Tax=Cinchona calisaya TaxID=153742 RepID=A0ABD3ACK3_9GENT
MDTSVTGIKLRATMEGEERWETKWLQSRRFGDPDKISRRIHNIQPLHFSKPEEENGPDQNVFVSLQLLKANLSVQGKDVDMISRNDLRIHNPSQEINNPYGSEINITLSGDEEEPIVIIQSTKHKGNQDDAQGGTTTAEDTLSNELLGT